jgi:plasmid stabilization system protein ParE
MRVRWTTTAVEHLLGIYEHIAQDAPTYALRVVDRLTRRSEALASLLKLGRTVPEYDAPDIRELIEPPYRIIYRVLPGQIDILAVVHGARLLPPDLDSLGRV